MTPKFDKFIKEADAEYDHRIGKYVRPKSWPNYHPDYDGRAGTRTMGPNRFTHRSPSAAAGARRLYFREYQRYTQPTHPLFWTERGKRWRKKHLSQHDIDTIEYAYILNRKNAQERKSGHDKEERLQSDPVTPWLEPPLKPDPKFGF